MRAVDCSDTISVHGPRVSTMPSWRRWAAIGLSKAAYDLGRCVRILEVWAERASERRRLLGLDARILKDIGVSGADAWREANKPFWRA